MSLSIAKPPSPSPQTPAQPEAGTRNVWKILVGSAVALAIFASLAAGVWWYFGGFRGGRTVRVDGAPEVTIDAISKATVDPLFNGVRVIAGRTRLRATNATGGYTMAATYDLAADWYNQTQWRMRGIRDRLLNDQAMAQFVKVTAEQKKQLEQTNTGETIALTDKEKASLTTLIDAWKGAKGEAKESAKVALVTAVLELGRDHYAATLERSRKQADQIAGILTKEQADYFQQQAGRGGAMPAGRGARRPGGPPTTNPTATAGPTTRRGPGGGGPNAAPPAPRMARGATTAPAGRQARTPTTPTTAPAPLRVAAPTTTIPAAQLALPATQPAVASPSPTTSPVPAPGAGRAAVQ